MKKKTIVIAILLAAIIVVSIGLLISQYENINFLEQGVEDLTEGTQVPSVDIPENSEVIDGTTDTDKDVQFDDYIKWTFDENSLLDKPEDSGIVEGTGYYVTDFNFSNGLVIKPSKNLELDYNIGSSAFLKGADGYAKIEIKEVSAIDYTIQQLRKEYLESIGFGYHASLDTNDIPYDAPYDTYKGLLDWEQYYNETQMFRNPSVGYNNYDYLLMDTITKTSYGNTMLVAYYNGSLGTYEAKAFISLMNNTRIVSIEMTNIVRNEYIWSYLIEITNDCLTLIK